MNRKILEANYKVLMYSRPVNFKLSLPNELKPAFKRKEEDPVNVPVWMCGKMGSRRRSPLALIISCNLSLTAALRAQMKHGPVPDA